MLISAKVMALDHTHLHNTDVLFVLKDPGLDIQHIKHSIYYF